MSTSQSPSLTVLESLCFEQVTFWVGVVARNGGASGALVNGVPFTRLPAGDLVANLSERLPLVSLTIRQVRKALNRLVQLGLVVREQFWQWRGCSDYWYSLPAGSVGGSTQGAVAVAPPRNPVSNGVTETVTPPDPSVTPLLPDGSHPCDQNGHPFLKPLSSSLSEQTRQTDEDSEPNPQPATQKALTREGDPVPPQVPSQGETAPLPQVEPTPPLTGRTVPSSAFRLDTDALLPSLPGPSGALMGLREYANQRIRALTAAFDAASVAPVSPSGVVIDGKVRRIDDGACAPIR